MEKRNKKLEKVYAEATKALENLFGPVTFGKNEKSRKLYKYI